jgi:hypothetical protein
VAVGARDDEVILYVHVGWYADAHSFKLTDVLALAHSSKGNVGAV